MTHGYTTGTGAGTPESTPSYGIPRQGPVAGPEVSTPTPTPTPASASSPAPKKPGRDRYLDLLRAIALVRVVVYHLFGWAWLSVLFPSMGVMFALAGSLMARSLSRPAMSVIRGRIRRLLPPLWAFSAVVLVMMFVAGWNPAKDPDNGGTWGIVEIINYVIPIGAPPYPWHLGNEEACWTPPGPTRRPGRCGTCGRICGSWPRPRCCCGRSGACRGRRCWPRWA